MTTNPYAEAVEAAARAIGSRASCEHERVWIDVPARRYENCFDCDGRVAVAAAVPHLTAGLREVAEGFRDSVDWSDGRSNYGDNEAYEACARRLTQALDAIEAGATSDREALA